MSLTRSDVVQLLTLWFVVLIFVRLGGSGSSNAFTMAVGVFALVLLWAIPLYIFVAVTSKFDAR